MGAKLSVSKCRACLGFAETAIGPTINPEAANGEDLMATLMVAPTTEPIQLKPEVDLLTIAEYPRNCSAMHFP